MTSVLVFNPDRMMKEDLDELPVIAKDMPDSWIHGQMCDPEGMILNRRALPDLSAAKVKVFGTLLDA